MSDLSGARGDLLEDSLVKGDLVVDSYEGCIELILCWIGEVEEDA